MSGEQRLKWPPAKRLCLCGAPARRPMGDRGSLRDSGCERCVAIESSLFAERKREASALEPTPTPRKKPRIYGEARRRAQEGYTDIIAACDRFLLSRGLHPGVDRCRIWSAIDCD